MLPDLLQTLGIYKFYEKWLERQVLQGEMPQHVGVIVDGNRRWAFMRALLSHNGHWNGAKVGVRFLEWCLYLGIKTVTVYAFSTENFARPPKEVQDVLSIIEEEARKLSQDRRLHSHRVRVKAIGRLELLPESLRNVLSQVEDSTKDYSDHFLNIAIAYGGRTEILDATRKVVDDALNARVDPAQLDEATFRKYLYTAHLPNPFPDLIIRTSGEERLSGFLLWQSAYSELVFIDVFWPSFRRIDLLRAVRTYQHRRRRFGR